jgi:hypothetical protein
MYTCPMHPEVVSDKPGRCPKCGMALVKKSEPTTTTPPPETNDTGLGPITWKSYVPLIVVIGVISVVSVITASNGGFSVDTLVINFMAGFFLVFAAFKLMDLKGFAEGYATYDLLAQRWRGYGYLYPFIELAFGLLMVAGFHPDWLLWTEFGVMLFSGLGVVIKLARHEPFKCACLGTFLKVPLTYVTVVEDLGMAALAVVAVVLLK